MPVLRRNFLVPAYDTRQEKLEDVTGLVLSVRFGPGILIEVPKNNKSVFCPLRFVKCVIFYGSNCHCRQSSLSFAQLFEVCFRYYFPGRKTDKAIIFFIICRSWSYVTSGMLEQLGKTNHVLTHVEGPWCEG